ncbi:hypothetical protein MNBD_NITROSPINAE04-2551 [hydrothermal vent metagenome]|uniref:Flagellar hook-length control protein-like C-terminal domain-containing protein n=1 Tax=hydrothermal vent metagenome TaxID=652676 RepID=A0A3B1BRR7_9ZZZZ
MWTGKAPPPNIFKAAIELFGSPRSEALFKKSEIVEGRVVKILSGNQALVRLSGVELVAVTDTKLLEGQKIVGRVDKVDPRITVSLLKGESASDLKTNALMRLLLPVKAPMGEVLSKVVNTSEAGGLPPKVGRIMESLSRDLGQALAVDLENIKPDKIRQTIKQSGLFLEAALKQAVEGKASAPVIRAVIETDVKAIIGKALSSVEEEIASLLKQIDKMADTKGEKDISAALRRANLPPSKPEQVYIPKLATVSEPVVVKKTASQAAQKPSPGAVMAELVKKASDAAKQLRDAYNNIELNQLLNASTRKKESGSAPPQALYQIPFFGGLNLQTARVYIHPGKDGENRTNEKKEGESRLVFMLEMSSLGPVRVDVSVQSKASAGAMSATGAIYALNDSVARFIKDNLPDLLKPLEALGYSARFEVSSADEAYVTEELENHTPITSRGIVDVKA